MTTIVDYNKTDMTVFHRHLSDHITHGSGRKKTVCVSSCLSFFGIKPHQYQYTCGWESILRRHGYSVRSRASELKMSKGRTTMSQLRTNLRRSSYGSHDWFAVIGAQQKSAHLMVLNGNGETVIDTAKGKKWKVYKVAKVTFETIK